MVGWQGLTLIIVPVAVPVVSLIASVGLQGGKGLAKDMGGVPSAPHVARIAHEAARAVGVPPPSEVYTIPSREANAFAAGGFLGHGPVVAVTEGLLASLNEKETKAVLAHEMGHIRHRDVGRNIHVAVAAAGLGGVYTAGRWLWESDRRDSRSRKKKSKKEKEEGGTEGVGLALMGIGLGAQGVANLLRLAASRGAEFDADAAAAEAFGAAPLISALRKISASSVDRNLRSGLAGAALSHAMISDGGGAAAASEGGKKKGRGIGGFVRRALTLMRTHPSLEDRVAALNAIDARQRP